MFLCCLIIQYSCIKLSQKNDEKNDRNASVWAINGVFGHFGGNLLGKASVFANFSSILLGFEAIRCPTHVHRPTMCPQGDNGCVQLMLPPPYMV